MSTTLAAVEAQIGLGRRRSTIFPPELERQFESDNNGRRCSRLANGIVGSAAFYNLFVIVDYLLLPDVWVVSAWIHFSIITPWMLIAASLISRKPPPLVRECIAATIPVLIFLQIDICFYLTKCEIAAHYQYVIIPTILYTNVSLHRLQFRFALGVTCFAIVSHLVVLSTVSYVSTTETILIVAQIMTCAYITMIVNVTMDRDQRRAYLASLRDRLCHLEAAEVARRDPLTGLPNRLKLERAIADLWAGGRDAAAMVSVIMVDFDHFKSLNDRYGHSIGDLCLRQVAALISAELPADDSLAVRYGGEEFLLVLPGMPSSDAVRLAERIRRKVEDASAGNAFGAELAITASFGVAGALISDLSSESLIAAADKALYVAKRNGRNRVWPPPSDAAAEPSRHDEAHGALL
uniref:diguanylate cyclase n=1 Tax=Rhodopseudomonas palustris (strain DX-1) TaxID=652103 RepID=E6VPJ8_RHOPX